MDYKRVISIHGAPRSGTSWLGQIFDSSRIVKYKFQPLFSDSFKDRINVRSSKQEVICFLNELYNYQDEFLDRTIQKKQKIYPEFKKDKNPEILAIKMVRYHYLIPRLLDLLDNIKIIGIVRHPCSFLNSWRKAPKEFPEYLDFNQQWRFAQDRDFFKPEEYFGFHKWKELSKLFLTMLEKYPKKFFMVQYENLVNNPAEIIKELFVKCGLDFEQQTENFIYNSRLIHQEDTYSVFKGKKNLQDWEEELDSSIIHEVERELRNTEFEQFLLQ